MSKREYMSPTKTRIRTYQSALTNVKYADEQGRRPLPFDPKTTDDDSIPKYYRRNADGEWIERDPDKYNFDC